MIFPTNSVDTQGDTASPKVPQGKTLAFDFSQGDFVVQDGRLQPLEGEDGLAIWVEKCIRTGLGQDWIYQQDSTPYGIGTVDLTNRKLPQAFLFAEIEREVTEALLRNPAVLVVQGFSFQRQNRTLQVSFTVESIYGRKEVDYQWLMT